MFCCPPVGEMDKIFRKGEIKLRDDLNFFQIVQDVQKLKSLLGILFERQIIQTDDVMKAR